MDRPSLKPETARRLSRALDGIESARAGLTAARDAGDREVVEAADAYLDAREEMGTVMGLLDEELRS